MMEVYMQNILPGDPEKKVISFLKLINFSINNELCPGFPRDRSASQACYDTPSRTFRKYHTNGFLLDSHPRHGLKRAVAGCREVVFVPLHLNGFQPLGHRAERAEVRRALVQQWTDGSANDRKWTWSPWNQRMGSPFALEFTLHDAAKVNLLHLITIPVIIIIYHHFCKRQEVVTFFPKGKASKKPLC